MLGVTAFVMFPLTGTGAIGGTIFGRLVGLGPVKIVSAVALGGVLGSAFMAVNAAWMARAVEPVRDTLWFRAIGVAVIILFVAFLVWQARRMPSAESSEGAPG
jgi:Na+/phosphate symporter